MREIKSFIKSASFAELNKAVELISEAINTQREQEKAKEEVLAMLKEKGLTVEDLMGTVTQDKRSKVEPKYRIEVDGEVHEWTGRGKTPKAFQGIKLEEHLI